MAITSLTYTVYGPIENRRVAFHYVTSGGKSGDYIINTTDQNWNPDDFIAAIEAKLNAKFIENEVLAWIYGPVDMPVIVGDATKQEYAAGIRAYYKEATKEDLWRLSYKLYERYQAGDFTAAQLQTAFGMTAQEFNDFTTNVLIPAHDNYAALQVAVGQ